MAQLLATYPVAGVPPATWTLFVDGRQFNLGRSKTRGFDFEASTRFVDTKLGDFLVGVNGMVFTKHHVAQTPAGALTDQLNTIYNPMKFKSRFMANWARRLPDQPDAVLRQRLQRTTWPTRCRTWRPSSPPTCASPMPSRPKARWAC